MGTFEGFVAPNSLAGFWNGSLQAEAQYGVRLLSGNEIPDNPK